MAPFLLAFPFFTFSVNCDEWERKEVRVWETQVIARVETEYPEGIHYLPPGTEVTEDGSYSLVTALEDNCFSAEEGGVPWRVEPNTGQ